MQQKTSPNKFGMIPECQMSRVDMKYHLNITIVGYDEKGFDQNYRRQKVISMVKLKNTHQS